MGVAIPINFVKRSDNRCQLSEPAVDATTDLITVVAGASEMVPVRVSSIGTLFWDLDLSTIALINRRYEDIC